MADWKAIINGIDVLNCDVELSGSEKGKITVHLPPHAPHARELQALETDTTQKHFAVEVDCGGGYSHAKFLKCYLDSIAKGGNMTGYTPEGGEEPGLKLIIIYYSG